MKLLHLKQYGPHWIIVTRVDEVDVDIHRSSEYLTKDDFMQFCAPDWTHRGYVYENGEAYELYENKSLAETIKGPNKPTIERPSEMTDCVWKEIARYYRRFLQGNGYRISTKGFKPLSTTKIQQLKEENEQNLAWQKFNQAINNSDLAIAPKSNASSYARTKDEKQKRQEARIKVVLSVKKLCKWTDLEPYLLSSSQHLALLVKKMWNNPSNFFS